MWRGPIRNFLPTGNHVRNERKTLRMVSSRLPLRPGIILGSLSWNHAQTLMNRRNNADPCSTEYWIMWHGIRSGNRPQDQEDWNIPQRRSSRKSYGKRTESVGTPVGMTPRDGRNRQRMSRELVGLITRKSYRMRSFCSGTILANLVIRVAVMFGNAHSWMCRYHAFT